MSVYRTLKPLFKVFKVNFLTKSTYGRISKLTTPIFPKYVVTSGSFHEMVTYLGKTTRQIAKEGFYDPLAIKVGRSPRTIPNSKILSTL